MRAILSILFVFALVASSFAQQTETAAAPVPATGETTMGTAKADKKATKEQELTEEQLNQQLFAAIAAGDIEQVKPLLNAMTYYKQNEEGETALTLAINNEDIPMVKLLAENAVINLKNKDGETPLTLAIKKGNTEVIHIVAVRAKAALKNDLGEAPLFLALEKFDDLHLLQKLVDKGADVNRKSNGETPLSLATQLNKIKTVALLIKNGADIGQTNDNGDLPLYIAVTKGHDVIAGILAHKSASTEQDVNWQNAIGEPLINIAASLEYPDVVKMLVDYGANVNATDYMDNTALTIAASKGNDELVKVLLNAGADVNHQNILGATALTAAVKNGHDSLAKTLAENGANPEIKTYTGYNASQYANFEVLKEKYEQTKRVDTQYQNLDPNNDFDDDNQ